MVSLIYKEDNILKTYAWIIETAFSRIIITRIGVNIEYINNLENGDRGLAINVSNKWPATIFAASRTDKVIGRIRFLVSSIITINGIKIYGVPEGTKCLKKEFKSFKIIHVKYEIQENKANESLNLKCLEAVKVYGDNPI